MFTHTLKNTRLHLRMSPTIIYLKNDHNWATMNTQRYYNRDSVVRLSSLKSCLFPLQVVRWDSNILNV